MRQAKWARKERDPSEWSQVNTVSIVVDLIQLAGIICAQRLLILGITIARWSIRDKHQQQKWN